MAELTLWNPNMTRSDDPRHRFFLREAYTAAAMYSDDLITKVGAVLVQLDGAGWRAVARGANHVPHTVDIGDKNLVELLKDRDWKYANIKHAEPAVIDVAHSRGIDTRGFAMYMPWVPCTPCAHKIIEAGIISLVTHEAMVIKTPERWWESTSAALALLEKSGIERIMYTDPIGDVVSTFNGVVWHP